ncbi:hypothetical protein [Brumimicrobium aurantiacum]|uniref:Uncharacterized protein n=1 Tax=Brumimicrobium aurantiacum TaxID=1737063 RepID=A0A3E1EX15_9FLAO|nr:hypothetical protein [Brumimicrobium aurantiacum]RFC54058.1 hypothetical protein DXU93_10995 [Brumimicrobium aurantiacum]
MNKFKIISGVLAVALVTTLMYYYKIKNASEIEIIHLKSEISQLTSVNNELDQNIGDLESEVDDLKYGRAVLFSELEELISLQEYAKAKEKILLLERKHPDAIETTKAFRKLNSIEEELLWIDIKNRRSFSLLNEYSTKYSRGKYIKRVNEMKIELIAENEQKAYDNVKS